MSELLIGAGLVAVVFVAYLFHFTRLRHTRAALALMRKLDRGEPLTEFEKLITREHKPWIVKRHPRGSDERQIEDIAFELAKLFPEWTNSGKPVPLSVLLDPYIFGFTLPVTTVVATLLGTDERVAIERRFAIWVHSVAALAGVEPTRVSEGLRTVRDAGPEIERGRLDGMAYLDALTLGKPPVAQGRLIQHLIQHYPEELDAALAL